MQRNPLDLVKVVASPAMAGGLTRYVVAPNGAYPGATAWLYHAGVSQPTSASSKTQRGTDANYHFSACVKHALRTKRAR